MAGHVPLCRVPCCNLRSVSVHVAWHQLVTLDWTHAFPQPPVPPPPTTCRRPAGLVHTEGQETARYARCCQRKISTQLPDAPLPVRADTSSSAARLTRYLFQPNTTIARSPYCPRPQFTDPFLNTFRGILPSFGGIDVSPMIGFLLLNFVRNQLVHLSRTIGN